MWCWGQKPTCRYDSRVPFTIYILFKGTSEATRSLMRPYCFLLTVLVHLQLRFAYMQTQKTVDSTSVQMGENKATE